MAGVTAQPIRRASAPATWTALVAVWLFWGSTFLGIRLAIESIPPFLMAGSRFLLSGAVLFCFARLRGAPMPTARQWLNALVVGTLLLGIGNGAVVWAERFLPSGLVALTVSTSPLWMVLIDRVFFGGRITWPQVAGVCLGLAGVAILANPTGAGMALLPLAVLVCSSVSWAAGTLLSRTSGLPKSTTLANGMEMLMGGFVLFLGGIFAGEIWHVQPEHFTLRSLAAVGWLIVFGSLVGFSCYLWLIRVAPVVLVSTQSYVSPVVAVALGVLLVGEHVSGRTLVAGAVILAAVVLVASAPLLTSRPEPEELHRGAAA
jgi:drug/metabolite transporter (DMT)-like permease